MAPTSARKRKASELDDGIPKPAKSPKKKSRTSKKDASTAPKSKWTWFIPNDPEDPILDSAYIGKVKLSEGFETSFGVVPADWGKIKQYRNVKCMCDFPLPQKPHTDSSAQCKTQLSAKET